MREDSMRGLLQYTNWQRSRRKIMQEEEFDKSENDRIARLDLAAPTNSQDQLRWSKYKKKEKAKLSYRPDNCRNITVQNKRRMPINM